MMFNNPFECKLHTQYLIDERESLDYAVYQIKRTDQLAAQTFTWYQKLILPIHNLIYQSYVKLRNKVFGKPINKWNIDEEEVYFTLENGHERRNKDNQLLRKIHSRIRYHMMASTKKMRRL